jgi:hypothetical protein
MRTSATFVLVTIAIGISAWNNSGADASSSKRALSFPTRTFLRKCDQFILLSLDPSLDEETSKSEQFHKYRVLGKTEVKDSKRKWELITALITGAERARDRRFSTLCFRPRHAIQALAGTNSVDLLVCFECGKIAEFNAAGQCFCEMADDAKEVFNGTLTDANVPLAKQ